MISKQRGKKKVQKPITTQLGRLALSGVTSRDWHAVRRYLEQHPYLIPLLPYACRAVRREFGPESELALEEYRDREIKDQYLTLYVRPNTYDANTTDRIERVSQSFEKRIKPTSGYLLVTTDFRRIKPSNGV